MPPQGRGQLTTRLGAESGPIPVRCCQTRRSDRSQSSKFWVRLPGHR